MSIIWQMHYMLVSKIKKKMLLSRDASTKHGRSLLAGASMLDALVLARLACALAGVAQGDVRPRPLPQVLLARLLQVVLLEVVVGAKNILSVPPASFASCLIAASSISQINSADLGLRWHGGY